MLLQGIKQTYEESRIHWLNYEMVKANLLGVAPIAFRVVSGMSNEYRFAKRTVPKQVMDSVKSRHIRQSDIVNNDMGKYPCRESQTRGRVIGDEGLMPLQLYQHR